MRFFKIQQITPEDLRFLHNNENSCIRFFQKNNPIELIALIPPLFGKKVNATVI